GGGLTGRLLRSNGGEPTGKCDAVQCFHSKFGISNMRQSHGSIQSGTGVEPCNGNADAEQFGGGTAEAGFLAQEDNYGGWHNRRDGRPLRTRVGQAASLGYHESSNFTPLTSNGPAFLQHSDPASGIVSAARRQYRAHVYLRSHGL